MGGEIGGADGKDEGNGFGCRGRVLVVIIEANIRMQAGRQPALFLLSVFNLL